MPESVRRTLPVLSPLLKRGLRRGRVVGDCCCCCSLVLGICLGIVDVLLCYGNVRGRISSRVIMRKQTGSEVMIYLCGDLLKCEGEPFARQDPYFSGFTSSFTYGVSCHGHRFQ